MAVPTITDVSPSNGLPAGLTLVRIEGTNFRLPTPPPATGIITGDATPTVSVTLDGEPADSVLPISTTVCWVVVPEYFGTPSSLPDAVDIVLKNLDDDGNPIAGETVTEADGYTYKRQDTTEEGALQWVTEQFIEWCQRHIIGNVALTAHPDYSDNPASGMLALSELPAVVLVGPTVTEDTARKTLHEQDRNISGDPDGAALSALPAMPVILRFELNVVGRTKAEALNLQEAVINLYRKRPRLKVLVSRGASDRISLQQRLVADQWQSFDDLTTHVRRAENAVEISGVWLRDTYGVETSEQVVNDAVSYEADEDAPTIGYESL